MEHIALLKNLQNSKFNAPTFEAIRDEHYLPMLKTALDLDRKEFNDLESQSAAPTFENTILKLETVGEYSGLVAKLFFNTLSTNSSPERQKLAQDISPLLAAFASDISLNAAVFQRVKTVHDQIDRLSGERKRLTEATMKNFVRNGALLPNADKDQLRAIDQRLSQLAPQFSDHVLEDTNSFEIELQSSEDFAGLPDSAREMYLELGQKKNRPAGVGLVGLSAPQFLPFMTYSRRRDLREKLWRAFNQRGHKKNLPLMQEILTLREKRAKLLGYENHAQFVLEERMAKTPQQVFSFIQKMLDVAVPAGRRDIQQLEPDFVAEHAGSHIMPWDYLYQSEVTQKRLHSIDGELLRPYFECSRVLAGVFEHARRLFNLKFQALAAQSKTDPSAEVYEVSDENGHVGLLYVDLFSRPSKRSGAWMTAFREQGYSRLTGKIERPLISIVCNFTPPTASSPSLLTLDDVRTLFHEFGHALHGLLSKCEFVSLGGTNVKWDFVELPSQLFENWVSEQDSLHLFAKHYKTGELLPVEMIRRLQAANRFQAGYHTVRQLQFALLDMKVHSTRADDLKDLLTFERETLKPYMLLPFIDGAQFAPAFSHIFSGGYSAGYYSYKWAEVLDADAFEAFKDSGLFNSELAARLKEHILSKGDSEEPEVLYRKFRGRDPDPNAALRRDGLLNP